MHISHSLSLLSALAATSTALTIPPTPTPTADVAAVAVAAASSTPSPIQEGLTADCSTFYLVKAGDTCGAIVPSYGISLEQFYSWNPAIGTDCSSLWAGFYVCVGKEGVEPTPPTTTTTANNGIATPTPVQSGLPNDCNKFAKVDAGDTCYNLAEENGIPLQSLYEWNPAVGSECEGLWAGFYICVGRVGVQPTPTNPGNGVATPTPVRSGMTKDCDSFYLVQPGDSCYAIAENSHVSLEDFYKWNPDVGSDCANLWANFYACVGVL